MRKSGVEVPGAEGDRHGSGRLESVVVDFNPDEAQETWAECKRRVQEIEKDWNLKTDNW